MRIVVLDGYTLNPGDLSWSELESMAECTVYERTPDNLIISRSLDAEILLVNKVFITAKIIEQLPNLAYIGVTATGFDIVDIKAAANHAIPVTNVPAYSTNSVAQLVFAHILNLCHHAAGHSDSVRQGKWSHSPDFTFWDYPLIELDGLTMGIIGLGKIGSAVAKLAIAFGMQVLAHDPTSQPLQGVNKTSLEDLLSKSDIVTLHCPLTEQTRGFMNAAKFHMMKKSAFFINTSRGLLVNEKDLADALNLDIIAGAGIDVMAKEPPEQSNLLFIARNCFITPHIAWATRAARERLMKSAAGNIRSFLAGEPTNVVNGVK